MSWMSLLSPLRWTRRSAATKSPLRGRGSSLLRSAVFTLSIIYFRFDFIVMGSVHINVPVKQKCSAYHVTRDFCYITRHFKLSLLFPYSVCGCSLTPSTENTAMCVWAPVKARSGFRGLNTHTQKIRFLFLSTESSHLLRCGSVWLCSLQISEMSITTLRESTSISALNTITPSSTCPSLVEGCYSNAGLRSVLRLTWLLLVIIRAGLQSRVLTLAAVHFQGALKMFLKDI